MDNGTLDIAHRMIAQAILEQNQRLDKQIFQFQAEMNSRGLLPSSIYVDRVQQACADATKERADIAWSTLRRCVQTAGVRHQEGLAATLKEAVAKYLPEHMDGLRYRVTEAAKLSGTEEFCRNNMPDEVHNARLAAREKVFAEIDLFILSIKAKPIEAMYHQQNVFNIHHSPVGSVQTGSHSVAHVSQTLNQQTQADLEKALRGLLDALASVHALPGHDKDEIEAIVRDAATEVAKSKPNLAKIKSYLPMIGAAVVGAIGVAADVRPAYEALKAAAAAINISLP